MNTIHTPKLILFLILLLILMTACGSQTAEPEVATNTPVATLVAEIVPTATTAVLPTPTLAPVPTNTPIPTPTATPIQRGDDTVTGPPPAFMHIGDQTQEAGIGTYCWTQGRGMLCIDAYGIPTPTDALLITGEFKARFQLPEPARLTTSDVYAIPITLADEQSTNDEGVRWWNVLGRNDRQPLTFGNDGTLTATAELPPGLYLINFFAAWDSLGDASYGFLVEIQ